MRIPRKLFGLVLDETIAGGAEPERIAGRGGADLITGGEGDDALRGNRGDDTLIGGEGDDTLAGGGGSDRLMGGAGVDLFRFAPTGGGQDTIEGYVATEDQLEFLGWTDVVMRVLSATEALVTFGPTGGGESVLLRGAVGEFLSPFALGDLAVSNNLRIEIAAGATLILPVGKTLRAPGDFAIVTEGPAAVPGTVRGDPTLGDSGQIATTGGLQAGGVVRLPGPPLSLDAGAIIVGAGSGPVMLPDGGVSLRDALAPHEGTRLDPIDGVLRVTTAAPRESGQLGVAAAPVDTTPPVLVTAPAQTESWPIPPDEAPLL